MDTIRRFKGALLGNPLHNKEFAHQRLSNPMALAVFASDALSSVAYATQEIMIVLAGTIALGLTWPIALGISVLLAIVAISYRQTIHEYPQGGGAYLVAKDNLGILPALIAAAALLVDYILTVSVSVSAGVAALTSAFPVLFDWRILIAVGFIGFIAIMNLRGVKESGTLFAIPTYGFVVILGGTLLLAIGKYFILGPDSIRIPTHGEVEASLQGIGLFLIARAFSSGCAALTGIEAIANGVQAFKEPVAKHARQTLTAMAIILVSLFIGVTFVAVKAGVTPSEHETVISQLGHMLYGDGTMYFVLQFATMMILILAANTAYADFPRLASFLANDDFLPHQFMDKGYRLVFSNGIVVLTLASCALIIAFGASTNALIPLYAVGVFTAFTLSQSGMVVHHFRVREPHWQIGAVINGVGAIATFCVLIVIAVSKFTSGAWMVLVILPIIIMILRGINKQYHHSKVAAIATPEEITAAANGKAPKSHHVVILTKDLDKRTLGAITYSKVLRADTIHAIHVDTRGNGRDFRQDWKNSGFDIPLKVIDSPYRLVIEPIVQHVRELREEKGGTISVIIADLSPDDRIDLALHDQTSVWLKWALFAEPGVVVVNVPLHFNDDVLAEHAILGAASA